MHEVSTESPTCTLSASCHLIPLCLGKYINPQFQVHNKKSCNSGSSPKSVSWSPSLPLEWQVRMSSRISYYHLKFQSKKRNPSPTRPLGLHILKAFPDPDLTALLFQLTHGLFSHIFCVRCWSSLSTLTPLFQFLSPNMSHFFPYPSWYNCMFPPRGVKWFVVIARAFPREVILTAIWCLQALKREKTYIIRKVNNDTKVPLLRFSGWLFKSEKQ